MDDKITIERETLERNIDILKRQEEIVAPFNATGD
jgi:hypothetical protein